MTLDRLNDFIKERHYPLNNLSKDLDISRQALYMKLSGEREFRASELVIMAKLLRMTNEEICSIFFDR